MKVSRDASGQAAAVETERFLFKCDKPNCYRRLTFKSADLVELERVNHKCPYWGGESKVSWSVTKTLVQQMWDKLDAEYAEIKRGSIDPEYNKARARAFAECIAIFMRPFFETADDIVKEAMRRYDAKAAGDTEYETPGIGHRRYETAAMAHASRADGWYESPQDGYTTDPAHAGSPSRGRGRRASGSVGAPAAAPAIKLSEADQSAIRNAHEQMGQIFTPAVLAKQYGVSEAVINQVLGA